MSTSASRASTGPRGSTGRGATLRTGSWARWWASLVIGALAVTEAACGGATGAVQPTTTLARAPATTTAVVPCPQRWDPSAPTPIDPSPARHGLADILVPPGPSSLSVCRYAGLNQPVEAGTVEKSHVVIGPALAQFVAYLDMPTWPVIPSGAIYNCPLSQGRVDLLQFDYPSGPGVTVTVDTDGCRFASNGVRTVAGDEIGARLARWVGIDS